MRQAIGEAQAQGIEQMVFGDLFLEDIREYRESRLDGTGIEPVFPLWQRPTAELAQEMIAAGVVAHVTCMDPRKIPRELAGEQFDAAFLARLPAEADPCAENGEFHTCVSAGPMFRKPIPVEKGETVERDGFVFTDLMLQSGDRAEGIS
jgi:diphthamide synthase (EF-2-diphthine--ammonia ligase)